MMEILLTLIALTEIILWIRSAAQIKDNRARALDIIVIGAILSIVPQFTDSSKSVSIAGVLIFSCGGPCASY